MSLLKTQAIQTALTGDWKTAVSLNQELLQEDPQDTEALNRLAFAFNAMGKLKEAKETYQQVLEIDKLNQIALRGLKRLAESSYTGSAVSAPGLTSNLFIEETGKTKVIELIHAADPKIIAGLRIGETVQLSVKRSKIFVIDEQKRYIGTVADNIGKRLVKLIDGGNSYDAYIKSLENHKIAVFVRETKRSLKFKNQPSFVSEHSKFVLHKNNQTVTNKKKQVKQEEDEDDYSESSGEGMEESL